MAYPIFPEERLLRKRTGSIGSRVGPAVMTNFTRSIDRAGAGEIRRGTQCPPLSKDGRGLRSRRRACLPPCRRIPPRVISISPRSPALRRFPTFFRSSPAQSESARAWLARWRSADNLPNRGRVRQRRLRSRVRSKANRRYPQARYDRVANFLFRQRNSSLPDSSKAFVRSTG